MNDRIKLAEAMGWKPIGKQPVAETVAGIAYLPKWQHDIFGKLTADHLPDPFTDANDDYAVLEWMRNLESNARYHMTMRLNGIWDYQIGDYARAALKVIDNE